MLGLLFKFTAILNNNTNSFVLNRKLSCLHYMLLLQMFDNHAWEISQK